MMYCYDGPAFRRADGSVVRRGYLFEPTKRELQTRGRFLHPLPETAQREPRADVPEDWPLVLSPQRYLELYPDGPQAERARAIVAQQGGAHGGD